MGSIGSKSKQSQMQKGCVKVIKVAGYKQLDESGSASEGETPVNIGTPKSKKLSNDQIRNSVGACESQDQGDGRTTSDALRLSSDTNITDELETTTESLSTSLITQVSPKTADKQNFTERSVGVAETAETNPLSKVNPLLKRKPSGAVVELGAISGGRLGTKHDVRKHLEQQGLLGIKNTTAIGEGIMGELREIGILKPNMISDDGLRRMSEEPKSRLPLRLTQLPVTESTFPHKVLERKFGRDKSNDEGVIKIENTEECVRLLENSGAVDDIPREPLEEVTKPSDVTALKIKVLNLDLI